jgi:hypothetical protein
MSLYIVFKIFRPEFAQTPPRCSKLRGQQTPGTASAPNRWSQSLALTLEGPKSSGLTLVSLIIMLVFSEAELPSLPPCKALFAVCFVEL